MATMESMETKICICIATDRETNESRSKSITDLPPELVAPICSYLRIDDLVRTMRTCKYLHAVGSAQLPKTISCELQSLLSFISRSRYRTSSRDPIKLTWRNDDLLANAEEEDSNARSDVLLGSLLKAVKRQLAKPDLPRVSLAPHIISFDGEAVRERDIYYAILEVLRYYSCSRSEREYAMQSVEARTQPYIITRFFDLHKLRKLTLKFHISSWQTTRFSRGVGNINTGKNYRFGEQFESDYRSTYSRSNARMPDGEPLEQSLETASDLAKLLRRAENLSSLSLHMKVELHHEYRPLKTLPPALEALSDAVRGLKRLRSLRLKNFLFHPGFFLPVPKNVSRLSFHNIHAYPKSWWMQFAKFPLKGLEALILRIHKDFWPEKPSSSFGELYGSHQHDTDGSLRDPREVEKMGFELGDVHIKGLRCFTYEDTSEYFLPRDLIPCILAKNKGIREEDMKILTESYGKVMAARCKLRWKKAAAEQHARMEKEFTKRLLEGCQHEVDIRHRLVEFSKRVTESLEGGDLKETSAEGTARGVSLEGTDIKGANIEETESKETTDKTTSLDVTNPDAPKEDTSKK
ncbi:hypothetical protein TWF225_009176 [Orbilia oligospora]|nr:hypothetical protein TWF225_009176 [Orbilia oligospora]KAF3193608.1 hypothetical protein TWF225_009176 [Orbilia oligospora]KAF3239950.1 hypothetical protein TWF128_011442 [Orbilia oligospora]KAF3239951.1 hypothetical protein TWF128_011442 [Orbilia oligospora]KAF3265857.1 hypothetical protein TWF217_002382 [Orbilia oligospora]